MRTGHAAGDVVLLIVGDEILSGKTKDANGGWLAERLDALGYRVRRIVILPDDDAAIRREARAALADAPTVISCGGLGSTHDDRTTEVLASEFGRRLVVDEAGWAKLRARYEKRYGPIDAVDPEMVASARKMVLVPEGATALANPVGAASGYVLPTEDGGRIVVMPGVPAEMQAMFSHEVASKLLPPRPRDAALELDVAMNEARFAASLERIAKAYPDVAVGSYPHWGELRVTLRFRGPAERAVAAREAFASLFPGEVLARSGDLPGAPGASGADVRG